MVAKWPTNRYNCMDWSVCIFCTNRVFLLMVCPRCCIVWIYLSMCVFVSYPLLFLLTFVQPVYYVVCLNELENLENPENWKTFGILC